MLYLLFGVQSTAFGYITWIVLPTSIAMYERIATRRALFAYIATNVFLITAVLSYYASYIFDVLFLNTNELLNELHYTTINWSLFFTFVLDNLGSEVVEWTAVALALGFVLRLVAVIIVALLEFVERNRAGQ